MIRAAHQTKEILVATQHSLSTSKTIHNELEDCNGYYEDPMRRRICRGKVLEHPGIEFQTLLPQMIGCFTLYHVAWTQ